MLTGLVGKAACAEQQAGAYVYLGSGFTYSGKRQIDDAGTSLNLDLDAPLYTASVGYAFQNGARTELDISKRTNDVEIVQLSNSTGSINTLNNSAVSSSSVMVSVLYDFDVGLPVQPFIGIGLGMVDLDYDISLSDRPFVQDNIWSAAFQLQTGVEFNVTPTLSVRAGYRFWMAPLVGLVDAQGKSLDTYHSTHAFELGVSFTFG